MMLAGQSKLCAAHKIAGVQQARTVALFEEIKTPRVAIQTRPPSRVGQLMD
jgi:hypothetical protein